LFDVDLKRFPLFLLSKPHKVIIEPGDALYIPNPWWHAVVALDDELQITLPHWLRPRRLCFSSPQTRTLVALHPYSSIRQKREGVDIPGLSDLLSASFPQKPRLSHAEN
jgi:hypothetical protein